MFHNLDIYRRLLGVQLRSQLQYRVAFAMDFLSTGLVVAVEFASVALVLQRIGTIGGWKLGEVAFLYGLVEMSFGLMDLLFSGFDPPYFGQKVRRGTFDQILLRPINVTVQVMGSAFALRRLGKVLLGFLIFVYALNQTQIDWTVAKLLYLPLVIGGMVAFFGGLFIIGATVTFWTIESIEVMNILTYGGSFLISFPMHIYQQWLRRFFTYVVPAILLNYYPALYFLDKSDPFRFPYFARFLAPIVGFAFLLFGLTCWRIGIQHYQSTGS